MTTGRIIARRAARIAFGAALAVGMALNVEAAEHAHGAATAHGFCIMWLCAIAAAGITALLVLWASPAPRGDSLLHASLVVPAVGLALALPLTIHLLFFLLIGGDARGFGEWVGVSVRVVGLAHLVFAALFALRAHGLAETARPRMSIAELSAWTVLASAVPLGWLVIPEAVTLITGFAVMPVMFMFDAIAANERTALPALPHAIVESWPAHR